MISPSLISNQLQRNNCNKMSKGKTVFVTGAGGFIGSHAVLELMEDGYDIVAVDNFFNSVMGDGTELPESLRR